LHVPIFYLSIENYRISAKTEWAMNAKMVVYAEIFLKDFCRFWPWIMRPEEWHCPHELLQNGFLTRYNVLLGKSPWTTILGLREKHRTGFSPGQNGAGERGSRPFPAEENPAAKQAHARIS
jgi:hypothetical protein